MKTKGCWIIKTFAFLLKASFRTYNAIGRKTYYKASDIGLLFVNRPILKPTNSSKKQSVCFTYRFGVLQEHAVMTCNKHFLFITCYQVLICSYFYKKVIYRAKQQSKNDITTISIDKETVALVRRYANYSEKEKL